MTTLEDELKGRQVYVEVHLRSGSGSGVNDTAVARTMLYEGTYQGTCFVGAQEMVVLADGKHQNRARFSLTGQWGTDGCVLSSEKTYIALNDIVSIDIVKKSTGGM